MESMRGTQSRAQGAGSSSRGIRDGASEGSRQSGLLGDPCHVQGRERVSTRVRGTESDGGGDGRGFPFPLHFATDTVCREGGAPGVPRLPGGREPAVSTQAQGPYDFRARRDRPVGLPHTPPQVSGVGASQGALEGDAFSAALRDSLDDVISTLHERLFFLDTALGASRRSRRRRRRLSSSFSDVGFSGGDGGRHVLRRAVARAVGRELEGNPRH